MTNAFRHKSLAIFRLVVLIQLLELCQPMILRLYEGGLADLASYTRTWMHQTVENMQIEDYTHRIHHKLAAGELELKNITFNHFLPPLIHYKPSQNSFLYMDTDGGSADISANWTLHSKILSLFGVPLQGNVHGHITGFTSDVAVRVVQGSNQLEMYQCVARFDHFELQLTGSLAADILHWFHKTLASAMQSRVEQTYCHMMAAQLLPWLRDQLEKFPRKLQVELSKEIRLSQILHSINTGPKYVDLEMKNRLTSGSTGLSFETFSILPKEPPTIDADNKRLVELFMDEITLQELVSSSHNAGLFKTNFTSPFLRTKCDVLCIGKLVPQLQATLGSTALLAVIRTQEPPIVRLLHQKIRLLVNVSFEIFVERSQSTGIIPHIPSIYLHDADQHSNDQLESQGSAQPSKEEQNPEDQQESWESMDISADHPDPAVGMSVSGPHPVVDPKGRIIWPRPGIDELVIDPEGDVDWSKRPGGPTGPPRPPNQGLSGRLGVRLEVGKEAPLVKIEITAEIELALQMNERRIESQLRLHNSKAELRQHQLQNMSQRTLDQIVQTSVPFAEDAVKIFFKTVCPSTSFLPDLHTTNESMRVEEGYIRFKADLNLQNLLTSL
uniref:Lipid-binding serum glycoprotein N-terminal domain-containing protein n=1 Tax=Ditylenchus dipsaci TaxID=166011 RepID=A0A915EPP1_9BILA